MEERNWCPESRIPLEKAEEFQRCLEEAGDLQKSISKQLTDLKTFTTYIKTSDGTSLAVAQSINPACPVGVNQLLEKDGSTVSVMSLLQNVVRTASEAVTGMFDKALSILDGLVCELSSLVDKWKSEFQLYYAKLLQEPELKEIALWCALVGKMIYEFRHENLIHYKNVLQNNNCYNQLETAYHSLWSRFIQCTFLVCKQENFVKTETKKFPEFTVRALAADYLNKMTSTVSAHFVPECELRKCFNGDDLDLKEVGKKEIKLTVYKKQKSSGKHELKSEKDKMQCSFSNLQFEKPFKRQQTKNSKLVHEEKFRMVFVTEMESRTYWTVSLPLVVIKASSQEVNGLASIMWQCFSTNVYSMQESTPEKLPCSKVVDMLQMMMLTLSQSHQLTEENINHLKYRLFGKEEPADEELVSLNQFCFENMIGVEFSFWKWFLGGYNLVKHLIKYWSDGLIIGFVKKKAAEEMLKACDRSGTFFFRFSDNELLKDGDGLKNVRGWLTASVLLKKPKPIRKSVGSKRKSNGGAEDGGPEVKQVERKYVEHFYIKKCPPKNLANIMKKETKPLYCHLYPTGKSPEDTFYKYLEDEEMKKARYLLPKDIDVTGIEQHMRELDIKSGTECLSTGFDSCFQSGPRAIKIAKRSENRSECDPSLSDALSPISPPTQSQLSLSQTFSLEQNPCFMENSPAQSVPAMQHLPCERSPDSVVPGSPDKVGFTNDPKDTNFEAENDIAHQEYSTAEDFDDNQNLLESSLIDPFISGRDDWPLNLNLFGEEFDTADMNTDFVNECLIPEGTYMMKEDISESDGEVSQTEAMISEERGIESSGNEMIRNVMMEEMSEVPEESPGYYGIKVDPDLEQLVEKTNELKMKKPEQYKIFLQSLMKDIEAMKTDCQGTKVNDAEDRALNFIEVDDIFKLNLSPFQRMMEEENQPGM